MNATKKRTRNKGNALQQLYVNTASEMGWQVTSPLNLQRRAIMIYQWSLQHISKTKFRRFIGQSWQTQPVYSAHIYVLMNNSWSSTPFSSIVVFPPCYWLDRRTLQYTVCLLYCRRCCFGGTSKKISFLPRKVTYLSRIVLVFQPDLT